MSSSTSSASASATTGAAGPSLPSSFKIVGVLLAVASGLLIGSSFVFKKKGLLASQAGHLGEGVAYLKSPMWWTGMIMMIAGEFCNFAAYAFTPAIVVTPLGALSVVICAILSSIFLKETLTFFGWIGCALCIVGSVIIALNGPQEASVGKIRDFQKLFLAPGFLALAGVLIVSSVVIVLFFIPRYGKKNMLWCIMVCSMIGGLSVSTTTGLGASIVTSIFLHENQFTYYFIYILLVFVVVTLLTEVYYLNMALALFNTAMVTPTYYVIFTFFSLVCSVVLFQGLHSSVAQILTVVLGFLVICAGITLLQMSKVDPSQLNKLDRRSTILLQAAQKNTENTEKSLSGMEDPGMDALRGSFGTVGSIIRARSARRMSQSSRGDTIRSRHGFPSGTPDPSAKNGFHGTIQRHQLYDTPMPSRHDSTVIGSDAGDLSQERISLRSGPPRTPTIKFGDQDVAHYYHGPGGPAGARHEMLASHGGGLSSPAPSHRSVAGGAGVGSQIQRQASPLSLSVDLERGQPLTAPPGESTFYHPRPADPFEQSPATSTGASFSGLSYDDEPPPPSSAAARRSASHRYRAGGGRHYPRVDEVDDREESVSLVHEGSQSDREGDSSESDVNTSGPMKPGGIRLLSSSTTQI